MGTSAEWICSRAGCGAVNDGRDERCERCGSPAGPTAKPQGGVCPFDGATLHANGWCPDGDGWPITRVVCPIVCDVCRSPLTWAGTCNRCREYAPGDRYEYTDKDPHWRLVERGPFTILPIQQQAHRAAAFGVTIAQLIARMAIERQATRVVTAAPGERTTARP